MRLANYLFFTDQCDRALAFYAECGLGKITVLTRHGDVVSAPVDEGMRGKVMHARFEGPGLLFFASDNHDAEPMRGSAHILMMEDRDDIDRLFSRLSAGGRVTTRLGLQPWGSYFGKLTDRFGVQWMFVQSTEATT